jgi:hypothetical protein
MNEIQGLALSSRLSSRFAQLVILCAAITAARSAFSQAVPETLAAPGPAPVFSTSAPAHRVPDLPDAPSPVPAPRAPADPDVRLEQKPHDPVTLAATPRNMLQDGAHIFVSPIYIRRNDLKWLLPLTGAAAAGFATDKKTMTEVVSNDSSFNATAGSVSDGLRDGLLATPVLMYVAGRLGHNDHAAETGILGSEAAVDAFVVDEVVKLASFRARPRIGNREGDFFDLDAGVDSAFVSGHTMLAWASAAAISGEYHSKWVQLAVYTAATGTGVSRILAQQHFPTDVLLGAAGGWLIGHYVVRAHHHADVAPER